MKETGLRDSISIARKYIQDQGFRILIPIYLIFTAAALFTYALFGFTPAANLAQLDRRAYFYLPYLVGIVYFVCSIWVFFILSKRKNAQAFLIFSSSTSIVLCGLFDTISTQKLIVLWSLSLILTGVSILDLAFSFPKPDPILKQLPNLRSGIYIFAIFLFLITSFWLISPQPGARNLIWKIEIAFSIASFILAFFWFLFRQFKMGSPIEREQTQLILLSGLVSFVPFLMWALDQRIPFYFQLSLVIFPVLLSYAFIKYRLSQSGKIVERLTSYGLLAIIVTVAYALCVSGLSLIFANFLQLESPIITGLLFFLFAVAFIPLRNRIEELINQYFFRGNKAYQEKLQAFSGELTSAVNLLEIIQTIRKYITQTISPTLFHIFIFDPLSDQYVATLGERNLSTSDIRFSLNSPFVRLLSEKKSTLFLTESVQVPQGLKTDMPRINLLATEIFTPLAGQKRLAGWIALGPRRSEESYSSAEMLFLESLSDQASLAIERAQILADMEDRVREMNVLTRISQGINITLDLDDILELIYAQTTQIISADDFQILIRDEETGTPVRLFYIAKNERFPGMENHPIGEEQLLERTVISQRRALITENYQQECEERGISVPQNDIFAWIGVPLNSRDATIGVLSLAKRDASTFYTQAQLVLLQAIADQVAGAIEKAKLLGESQRRTAQLASLNEVSKQLASTLNIEDLLQNILSKAVMILDCEAGSLMLLDQDSNELVFRVTAGPLAKDLLGRRITLENGVVGKSVISRKPVVINNMTGTPELVSQIDLQAGFETKGLLVAPMEAKGKVIGAIEVLNKRDGSPFKREDEQLLVAFAAQAAVAFENARLYTSTDQALESRIEELSVLQRIGRELNASLDASRAMSTTLEWAIRKSNINAGLVGIVEPSGVMVMASHGYSNELEPYQEKPISLEQFNLGEIFERGLPVQIPVEDRPGGSLLKDAKSQVIFPIKRELSIIGMLLLEKISSGSISDEAMMFLQRLTDLAAIAISNAQLYSAVRKANLAKSEFVSFVSHELRNPMTSIKGFTELLAAGAVGTVSEPQMNFLSTIRTNVDRMAILVSDLADESRIEAGKLKLDFQANSPKEIIEEVVRSLRKLIEEKKQILMTQLSDDIPNVWVDRTRLIQILTNLISNAYKYTQESGKIDIIAQLSENQWDDKGAAKVVHFQVVDSGFGINPEDQKKIFTKFFRAEDSKVREMSGTGLGLNITRSLVELQGGKIWFESEHRKGTTFHFTMPVSE
jgi:K+-sensing histidine kinase KdpD